MRIKPKCVVYARVATYPQADPQTDKKLKAVRLLQEIGYTVAVAPMNFTGDPEETIQIPSLQWKSESCPAYEHIRALLHGEKMLVITGTGGAHA